VARMITRWDCQICGLPSGSGWHSDPVIGCICRVCYTMMVERKSKPLDTPCAALDYDMPIEYYAN
jgi:hypothetical protein